MQLDVVGLGHCAVDYLGVLGRYPEVDSKTELSEFSMQGGGPVATAMVTLATLGVSAGFFGKISDDDFGIFIRQGLRDAGVDTSGLVIEPGKVSPYSFIAVERMTAKRTVFWTRGNVAPMKPDEIRYAIRQTPFSEARELAREALAARTSAEVSEVLGRVRERLHQRLLASREEIEEKTGDA